MSLLASMITMLTTVIVEWGCASNENNVNCSSVGVTIVIQWW